MTKYSKINIVYRLQKWMDSVPGQTFLNYAYSWGAAVVILGTLFKLTHLPGANFMLFLGMGTEVVVFFLSAFDRPFDKTADGMDLPTHLRNDEEPEEQETDATPAPTIQVATPGEAQTAGGGTIIIGGGGGFSGGTGSADGEASTTAPQVAAVAAAVPGGIVAAQAQPVSPDMVEATGNYIEELTNLTETLKKVSEQSARLTTDSEEMENLNRTLTGICKVYEMQLKSASSQIGTIDQINEQTKQMAAHIEHLNKIYARMIEAMTMNMPHVPGQQ